MPSPFPGMDPYLETHWRDVHARLIIYASDALRSVLPHPLRARVEERVVLATAEGWTESWLFPDVRIVEYAPSSGSGVVTRQSAAAVAVPMIVDSEVDPITENFIEIVDRGSGNRVVTVIEFLSQANKLPGANREQYLTKQAELCQSDTNL